MGRCPERHSFQADGCQQDRQAQPQGDGTRMRKFPDTVNHDRLPSVVMLGLPGRARIGAFAYCAASDSGPAPESQSSRNWQWLQLPRWSVSGKACLGSGMFSSGFWQ